jgi:glutathione S-transferase
MAEIILHHYPQSPVAEKVRTGLGLKRLAWRSVEQNCQPDRPELLAMTGGYRRIPVLQIGANIYCDSQCILLELERRHPSPSFFPNNGAGLPFALSRWTDGPIFDLAFRLAFAPAAASLPAALVADRARLYLGPDGDLAKEAADLPHTLSQLRAQLGWVETRLSTGRRFMLADEPGSRTCCSGTSTGSSRRATRRRASCLPSSRSCAPGPTACAPSAMAGRNR